MFLDKFIPKKYLIKSEVCSLEAVLTDEGMVYHFTVLKNKGKKLDLVCKGTVKDKINLPKQVLKAKIPIMLVVNGKGIVIKKINLPQQEELNAQQIVDQNLPAINREDLYIQIFRQNDRTAFITLCRKEVVNCITDELRKSKHDVAEILIGTPSVIGLQPLWSSFNRIATSRHSIELSNGNIDTILNGSEQYETIDLEGMHLEKENVLGFAAGFSYLTQHRMSESPNEELERIIETHLAKNKFRFLTLTCVAIAFVISVTNVLFYTNYFDRNNKLETQLSVYQGKYDEVNKLLSDYESKKDLIEDAGVLNRNKISEYADRIGATIPQEVILGQMYFNPIKEDIESEDSLVVFETRQLIIKGNCNKSLLVNEWLNVLKMQEFVKVVSLEKFSYNKEGSVPNFEIKIITK